MEPALFTGDVVFASSLLRVKQGDIAVLQDPQDSCRLLLKRILRLNSHGYWVQGDNKEASYDSRSFGWVPRELFKGRAWRLVPCRVA